MENNQKYHIHQSYSFDLYNVLEVEDRVYLIVTDGQDLFKLLPYNFQVERGKKGLPQSISCYVKALNNFGKPLLTQSRREILMQLYPKLKQEYPFTVVAVHQDVYSGWIFYQLLDPYGVKHRYYPKDDETPRKEGEAISLYLKNIEDKDKNKAYLNLISPELIKPSHFGILEGSGFGMETDVLEFKRSIVFTSQGTADIDIQLSKIVATLAGFMNKNGGRLLIGVKNNGQLHGIEADFPHLNSSKSNSFEYPENVDGYELKIRDAVKYHLGNGANAAVSMQFKQEEGKLYVEVRVDKILRPVYFDQEKIFQRASNTTQQFKGEDITWFVQQRLILSKGQQNTEESYVPLADSESCGIYEDIFSDSRKVYAEKTKSASSSETWAYFTFYKNGDWSFQPQPQNDADVLHEVAITEKMKKASLLMVYDNGKINAVVPEQMIYSLGKSGKVFKYPSRRYKNGWNTNARFEKLILANSQDTLLVISFDEKGKTMYKIHEAGHIGINSLFHCEGNVLVNKRLGGTLLEVFLLEKKDAESLRQFRMKKEQTSSSLGFSGDESIYLDRVVIGKQ
jgi:hypothetical protein